MEVAAAPRETSGRRAARWLLIAFYGIAGVAHLIVTEAMVKITPPWVPYPRYVVLATGLCELAGVIGLMVPAWRRRAGWAFAIYAVCVYPANVQHALIDLGNGTGLGWAYHGPRLLLQPWIVWWALWATGIVNAPRLRRAARPR